MQSIIISEITRTPNFDLMLKVKLVTVSISAFSRSEKIYIYIYIYIREKRYKKPNIAREVRFVSSSVCRHICLGFKHYFWLCLRCNFESLIKHYLFIGIDLYCWRRHWFSFCQALSFFSTIVDCLYCKINVECQFAFV